jgi:hypothetical protein
VSTRSLNGERTARLRFLKESAALHTLPPQRVPCITRREGWRGHAVTQSSSVPSHKWVITMYLNSTSLKGVSSTHLQRDRGLAQKAAWLLAQKICQEWIDRGELAAHVEVDLVTEQ